MMKAARLVVIVCGFFLLYSYCMDDSNAHSAVQMCCHCKKVSKQLACLVCGYYPFDYETLNLCMSVSTFFIFFAFTNVHWHRVSFVSYMTVSLRARRRISGKGRERFWIVFSIKASLLVCIDMLGRNTKD